MLISKQACYKLVIDDKRKEFKWGSCFVTFYTWLMLNSIMILCRNLEQFESKLFGGKILLWHFTVLICPWIFFIHHPMLSLNSGFKSLRYDWIDTFVLIHRQQLNRKKLQIPINCMWRNTLQLNLILSRKWQKLHR